MSVGSVTLVPRNVGSNDGTDQTNDMPHAKYRPNEEGTAKCGAHRSAEFPVQHLAKYVVTSGRKNMLSDGTVTYQTGTL